MNDTPRKHFNLYYVFLADKEAHPPPEDKKQELFNLLFPEKKE